MRNQRKRTKRSKLLTQVVLVASDDLHELILTVEADCVTEAVHALNERGRLSAPGFAVENSDKKGPFNLSVFEGKSVGNRVVAGAFENGSDGRALDELQYLIIDAFLGAVAQIGQHAP